MKRINTPKISVKKQVRYKSNKKPNSPVSVNSSRKVTDTKIINKSDSSVSSKKHSNKLRTIIRSSLIRVASEIRLAHGKCAGLIDRDQEIIVKRAVYYAREQIRLIAQNIEANVDKYFKEDPSMFKEIYGFFQSGYNNPPGIIKIIVEAVELEIKIIGDKVTEKEFELNNNMDVEHFTLFSYRETLRELRLELMKYIYVV